MSRHKTNLYASTMQECGLIDIGFIGPRFTWYNKRKGDPIHERLDRCWVNSEWFETFPETGLYHLPKITSDHCPIKLMLQKPIKKEGEKSFRFELMWLLHPQYEEIIEEAWLHDKGVISNLDRLRIVLLNWNRDIFGNVYKRKNRAIRRLEGTQIYIQNHPNSIFHLEQGSPPRGNYRNPRSGRNALALKE